MKQLRGMRKQDALMESGKLCGVAAMVAAGSAIVGGVVSSKNASKAADAAKANNAAQIEANQVDPRIQNYLYGDGTQTLKPGTAPTWGQPNEYGQQVSTNSPSDYTTNNGLLGQYMGTMNKPQDWALSNYGNDTREYLAKNGASDMNTIRGGALQQMQGISAPSMKAAQMEAPLMTNVPLAKAAQLNMDGFTDSDRVAVKPTAAVGAATVNGPAQDKMDLTKSFDSLINGDPGANPFLTGAIQKGINQSQNAFQKMQDDSTQNLREFILPSVRSGSLLSGQYGGSRQGIAEGRALGDFATEQQRAISQFGQNNTDAAVSAQAAAYNTDRDRALSATQGLSGQQYGSAIANANNAQSSMNQTSSNSLATNLANAQLQQQLLLANKQNGLQAAITQGGFDQQTNLANQNAILGVGQNNQQTQYGTNTNNMNALNSASGNNLQAQLTTNQLNSNNLGAGMAGLGGLLGSALGTAQEQDQYSLNSLSKGMGVLTPYLSKGAAPTQLQPVYNNSAAAGLGGALAGAQLGQAVYTGYNTNGGYDAGAIRQSSGGAYDGMSTGNYNYQPSSIPQNTGLLQNTNWLNYGKS